MMTFAAGDRVWLEGEPGVVSPHEILSASESGPVKIRAVGAESSVDLDPADFTKLASYNPEATRSSASRSGSASASAAVDHDLLKLDGADPEHLTLPELRDALMRRFVRGFVYTELGPRFLLSLNPNRRRRDEKNTVAKYREKPGERPPHLYGFAATAKKACLTSKTGGNSGAVFFLGGANAAGASHAFSKVAAFLAESDEVSDAHTLLQHFVGVRNPTAEGRSSDGGSEAASSQPPSASDSEPGAASSSSAPGGRTSGGGKPSSHAYPALTTEAEIELKLGFQHVGAGPIASRTKNKAAASCSSVEFAVRDLAMEDTLVHLHKHDKATFDPYFDDTASQLRTGRTFDVFYQYLVYLQYNDAPFVDADHTSFPRVLGETTDPDDPADKARLDETLILFDIFGLKKEFVFRRLDLILWLSGLLDRVDEEEHVDREAWEHLYECYTEALAPMTGGEAQAGEADKDIEQDEDGNADVVSEKHNPLADVEAFIGLLESPSADGDADAMRQWREEVRLLCENVYSSVVRYVLSRINSYFRKKNASLRQRGATSAPGQRQHAIRYLTLVDSGCLGRHTAAEEAADDFADGTAAMPMFCSLPDLFQNLRADAATAGLFESVLQDDQAGVVSSSVKSVAETAIQSALEFLHSTAITGGLDQVLTVTHTDGASRHYKSDAEFLLRLTHEVSSLWPKAKLLGNFGYSPGILEEALQRLSGYFEGGKSSEDGETKSNAKGGKSPSAGTTTAGTAKGKNNPTTRFVLAVRPNDTHSSRKLVKAEIDEQLLRFRVAELWHHETEVAEAQCGGLSARAMNLRYGGDAALRKIVSLQRYARALLQKVELRALKNDVVAATAAGDTSRMQALLAYAFSARIRWPEVRRCAAQYGLLAEYRGHVGSDVFVKVRNDWKAFFGEEAVGQDEAGARRSASGGRASGGSRSEAGLLSARSEASTRGSHVAGGSPPDDLMQDPVFAQTLAERDEARRQVDDLQERIMERKQLLKAAKARVSLPQRDAYHRKKEALDLYLERLSRITNALLPHAEKVLAYTEAESAETSDQEPQASAGEATAGAEEKGEGLLRAGVGATGTTEDGKMREHLSVVREYFATVLGNRNKARAMPSTLETLQTVPVALDLEEKKFASPWK
eukprot:g6815.t1